MAFRELAYQSKTLAALDAWLERLVEERAETDDYIAFQQSRGRPIGNLPDFPAKAWERLAAEKGVPGGRAYSPRRSGDGQPVPNVTLKVPTGGGQNLSGVRRAQPHLRSLCRREYRHGALDRAQ